METKDRPCPPGTVLQAKKGRVAVRARTKVKNKKPQTLRTMQCKSKKRKRGKEVKFAVCQCATQSKIREISIFLKQYYRVKVPGYLDTAVQNQKIDENENSCNF